MLDLAQEEKLFNHGYKLIAGIDEAGRGPLAGPVVAACVVLKNITEGEQMFACLRENNKLKLVKDSKRLTAKKREELYTVIEEQFDVGIGICDHQTIDKINILQAAFLAMKKAVGALKEKPDFIMLDGRFEIPNCSYQQQVISRGDETIFSIAAASIIAKVSRDRIMCEIDKQYPLYGFAQHKGYGTRLHLERLNEYGPCLIHRNSFKPVAKLLKLKHET